jgi:hypothetical protein
MTGNIEPAGLAWAWTLLLALGLAGAAGAEQVLDDSVETVTLYSDQALVTRTASARTGDGRHRLVFAALPNAVDHASIRVLVDGGRLLGFEVVRGYGEAELPPELEARRDRIEAIDRELAVLDGNRAVWVAEVSLLTNLPAGQPTPREDGTLPPVDARAMGRFLDWSAGRLDRAGGRINALDLQRVVLVEEREVLVSELLGTQGAGAVLSRPRVVAEVEMEGAGTASLTLVYRTWDARWVPSYDVRLFTGSDEMELGLNALVWQQTEEDWDGVELKLSTAIPGRSAALPEVMAWFIEETPPPPPPPPIQMAPMEAERATRGRRSASRSAKADAAPASVAMEPYPEESLAADYDYDYAYGDEMDDGIAYDQPIARAPEQALYDIRSRMDGRQAPTGSLTEALRGEASARAYLQDRSWPLLDTANRQILATGGGGTFEAYAGQALLPQPAQSTQYESSVATWGPYAPASNAMGFDFAFEVEGDATVPSDGQVHKVPLVSTTLPSRIEYVIVPVLEEAAFVQAVVDNGSPYPMLAGMSNVFLDGGYLGRLPTHTVAPGEPLELALGIDRSVKVERRQEQLSDKSGLFGNHKVRVYQITVELESYRDRPVDVRLFDRVPYTYDEDIKLTVGERSREPHEDHGTGMLEWHLELPAGAREQLVFSYTLKHHKHYRVWHP